MGDIPLLERTEASKRFWQALYWETVARLAGAFEDDRYWTDRITLLTEMDLSLLRRAMLEGVPDVGWIDGLHVGSFLVHDVVTRAEEVWSVAQ